jgi:hypothetical protein
LSACTHGLKDRDLRVSGVYAKSSAPRASFLQQISRLSDDPFGPASAGVVKLRRSNRSERGLAQQQVFQQQHPRAANNNSVAITIVPCAHNHAGSAVNFPRLCLTQLGRAVRRYTYAGAALVSDADNLRLVHAPLFGACDLFRPALQPAAHVNQTAVRRLQCPNQPSQSHYIQMKAASTDAPRTTLAANTTTSQHIQVCAMICIL